MQQVEGDTLSYAAAAVPDDRREAALDWAERSRSRRAELRDELRSAHLDLVGAFRLALDDDHVGAVKLLFVLESLPGARKTDTRRTLARLGIDPATPVGRLDDPLRRELLDTFGVPGGPDGPTDRPPAAAEEHR